MKLGIYSVFDVKTQAYMQPFYSLTPGAAIRSFSDALLEPTSMLCKHPEDFHLYQIGEFDDATSAIVSHPPIALGNAADYQEATA